MLAPTRSQAATPPSAGELFGLLHAAEIAQTIAAERTGGECTIAAKK
jgi:hypothetical protein